MHRGKSIIIQSMWRSGGTYWWGKFREFDTCYCFYEPLHEDLAFKSTEEFKKDFESGISGALRHSNIKKDYYSEYPFDENWFSEFHRNFSFYKDYYNDGNVNSDKLQDYIANLISFAQNQGRIPVIKLVRGSLRPKIFSDISATNIYILRDFDAQFESTVFLNGLGPLFKIIKENNSHWFFSGLYEFLNSENIQGLRLDRNGKPAFESKRQVELYRSVLFFFWVLSLLCNLECADMIINHDYVGEQKYKAKVKDQLDEHTKLLFNLDDYKVLKRSYSPFIKSAPEVVEIIRNNINVMQIDLSLIKNHYLGERNLKDLELILG